MTAFAVEAVAAVTTTGKSAAATIVVEAGAGAGIFTQTPVVGDSVPVGMPGIAVKLR
ncbi:MAG: hypothetical protein K9K38_22895 [Rhodoferax sp.]|nr:hypothetical protein [Rhodoferax sp.]